MIDTLDAILVPLGDGRHGSLIGASTVTIAIAPAHVRHVDAQHPKQAIAFARRDISQGVEKLLHVLVCLGLPALVDTAREGSAQDRKNSDVGPVQILKKQDLKLNGVLHGVAVVLHSDCVECVCREFIHQLHVGDGFTQRCHERLASEPEDVGVSVVRSSEHDKGAVLIRGQQIRVSIAVGFPASHRADVRSGDSDERLPGSGSWRAQHEFGHGFTGFFDVAGIGGTGVRSLALGRLREFDHAGPANLLEFLIFEKARLAQRIVNIFLNFTHLYFARHSHQALAQVESGLLAVETGQAGHQFRGDEEHGVCETKRVANQQAGMLRIRRRDEVEVQPQTRKGPRHYNQYRMAVLITGANGGLGRVVVEAFLVAGATVYGAGRAWKEKPSKYGASFHPVEADLMQALECDRVAALAAPVDALVHLVGGFAGGKPVADTRDDTWDQMLSVNLRCAISMFRAVLPQMRKAGKGRIVAMGSRAALEPMPNFAPYGVSKAALVALVKTTALEEKDSGITVNAVLPSVIDTPANRAAMPAQDASKWVKAESIAGLLVWLASDAARDVSGAAIPIYGKA